MRSHQLSLGGGGDGGGDGGGEDGGTAFSPTRSSTLSMGHPVRLASVCCSRARRAGAPLLAAQVDDAGATALNITWKGVWSLVLCKTRSSGKWASS